MSKQSLKTFVRGAYDIQKMRIQLGNRITAVYREQNGIAAGETLDKMEKEAKRDIIKIMESYKRMTDGIANFPTIRKFKSDKVISNYTMFCLVDEYQELLKSEEKHFKRMGQVLQEFPIYNDFLLNVKGVGPAMAGVIISEFDIHRATYPSSMIRYAGLDVVRLDDGTVEGRSRKKHHLTDQEYKDSEGETKLKKGITYNPFLKTKLCGVLGSSFIKIKDCKYREIYDDYKYRLENMQKHKEKTKLHRHNMANRYMIKMFIYDLYSAWRKIEGLEDHGTYERVKLGLVHKKIETS